MSDDVNQRHKARMVRKKRIIDASIDRANQEKGLLLVITGNGKGKSTSAFGMIGRALGHGMKVGVCQFIKSRTDTGEEAFFANQENVDWQVLGDGFTWDTQDREKDIATSKKAWVVALSMLTDDAIDLVILDELTYLLSYGYLDSDEVMQSITNRPAMQHVVVTGRGASQSLCELADTVSDIDEKKHAYQNDIQAQKGIDY